MWSSVVTNIITQENSSLLELQNGFYVVSITDEELTRVVETLEGKSGILVMADRGFTVERSTSQSSTWAKHTWPSTTASRGSSSWKINHFTENSRGMSDW